MKITIRNKSGLMILLTVLTLLVTAFAPVRQAYAQDDSSIVIVPTPQAPSGTVYDTTPTFKWTVATGATKYQFRVFYYSSLIYTISASSIVCGASICTKTPAAELDYSSYKWQIRAYIAGAWKPWSALVNFRVVEGFLSQFNNSMSGWARLAGGTWNLSPSYIYSTGIQDWNSVYFSGEEFTNFDYSVRVKRTGGITSSGGVTSYPFSNIAIRTGKNYDPVYHGWYPGYFFGYTNGGEYYIGKTDASNNVTFLKGFTATSAIKPNDWNVLRVVAVSSTMKFYINGTLLETVSDTTNLTGYVGAQFYKFTGGTATKYQIDWAKLIAFP